MRTLGTIIVIVIFLLGGSYASYGFVKNTTQATEAHLKTVEQSISAQQWEEAKKELGIVQESWKNNANWWSIILDHQQIDTIDLSIGRLERFIGAKDIPLSMGELSDLQLLFSYLFDAERFNLQNIF
ncbi:hypothetical protein DP73_02655 [Desulfosporosinus sp. HMP52]|uniref:DUF4363 family protein n=1 Tax=Desulfosporosinus sp. HMP52 TaxID=1487923 RepID=UPI00051FDBF9|nr:DUF4363 family protein [Desulfosporosinus sp. HMP52]KGK91504.1 hypothetical protein DP73_02655 [Desulfosporosinus sp. HMP52]